MELCIKVMDRGQKYHLFLMSDCHSQTEGVERSGQLESYSTLISFPTQSENLPESINKSQNSIDYK